MGGVLGSGKTQDPIPKLGGDVEGNGCASNGGRLKILLTLVTDHLRYACCPQIVLLMLGTLANRPCGFLTLLLLNA